MPSIAPVANPYQTDLGKTPRERAVCNGRQGMRFIVEEEVTVLDPDTMTPVPWDGETIGEIMFRGKITMKGYLKNPAATVEDVLYRHPAVFAAAVVAEPEPKWGESPCAFVELKPEMPASEADLIAHCRASLAHFKAPKSVVFGTLPKTATGKIQKYLLRERARSTAALE